MQGDEIIARIGEDEFAILLQNVDENMADNIIKRLQVNFKKTNNKKSEPALRFFMGASTAKKGVGLNSVLKQAEAILYLGKKKNNYSS